MNHGLYPLPIEVVDQLNYGTLQAAGLFKALHVANHGACLYR